MNEKLVNVLPATREHAGVNTARVAIFRASIKPGTLPATVAPALPLGDISTPWQPTTGWSRRGSRISRRGCRPRPRWPARLVNADDFVGDVLVGSSLGSSFRSRLRGSLGRGSRSGEDTCGEGGREEEGFGELHDGDGRMDVAVEGVWSGPYSTELKRIYEVFEFVDLIHIYVGQEGTAWSYIFDFESFSADAFALRSLSLPKLGAVQLHGFSATELPIPSGCSLWQTDHGECSLSG